MAAPTSQGALAELRRLREPVSLSITSAASGIVNNAIGPSMRNVMRQPVASFKRPAAIGASASPRLVPTQNVESTAPNLAAEKRRASKACAAGTNPASPSAIPIRVVTSQEKLDANAHIEVISDQSAIDARITAL